MARDSLIIRADASTEIGTGHVLRCLALAQAWQDAGGRPVFAMALPAPSLEDRLQAAGINTVYLSTSLGSIADAVETAGLAVRFEAAWIVTDGYHFGAEYQRTIKERGGKLLLIDDIGGANGYEADIVLNQNISAHASLYVDRAPSTQLLLGTRYALLRRDFLRWHGWQREVSVLSRKVLITLGGSDPHNCTLRIIQALQQSTYADMDVRVLVGSMNPNRQLLLESIGMDDRFNALVDAVNMPELMTWADMAIVAGGSTCWEAAFLGLPTMVVVLAANQEQVAIGLDVAGIAVNLGWDLNVSTSAIRTVFEDLMTNSSQRRTMSELGRRVVDGLGGRRVLMALQGADDGGDEGAEAAY